MAAGGRGCRELCWERQVQDGLESFLRDETTRRDLLDKEVQAPGGEAKRALAGMRAAISATSSTAAPPSVAPAAAEQAKGAAARVAGRTLG